jgi:hypothetical protein
MSWSASAASGGGGGDGYVTVMLMLFGLAAVLGAIVAAYALLAWRRRRSPAMLALAIGLLALSVGPFVEWVAVYLVNDNVYDASMGCAMVLIGGFACLLVATRTRFA